MTVVMFAEKLKKSSTDRTSQPAKSLTAFSSIVSLLLLSWYLYHCNYHRDRSTHFEIFRASNVWSSLIKLKLTPSFADYHHRSSPNHRHHLNFKLITKRQNSNEQNSTTFKSHQDQQDDNNEDRFSWPRLLFSIISISISMVLLFLGQTRLWLVISLGSGTAIGSVVWVILINALGPSGLTRNSSSSTGAEAARGFALLGIVLAGGLLGIIINVISSRIFVFSGSRWIGLSFLSIQSGFFLSIIILLFGNDLSIHIVGLRWMCIGLISATAWFISPLVYPPFGICFAYVTISTFFLFLGVDLLANKSRGYASGIKFMLDSHYKSSYDPPASTRVLLSLSIIMIIVGTLIQYRIYLESCKNKKPNLEGAFSNERCNELEGGGEMKEQTDFHNRAQADNSVHDLAIGEARTDLVGYTPTEDCNTVEDPSLQRELQLKEEIIPEGVVQNSLETIAQSESINPNTSGSNDTGLSAIPEATERSRSDSTFGTGRRGSRSGSGSARGAATFGPQSHRHPSNATSNSIRRSTYSSDQGIPTTSGSNGGSCSNQADILTDPSIIPVSPPGTFLVTETSVSPEESVSQAARRPLVAPTRLRSSYIAEETEVVQGEMMTEKSPQSSKKQKGKVPHPIRGGGGGGESSNGRFPEGNSPGSKKTSDNESRRQSSGALNRIIWAFNNTNSRSSGNETREGLYDSATDGGLRTTTEVDSDVDKEPNNSNQDHDHEEEAERVEDEERLLDSDAARWVRLTKIDEENRKRRSFQGEGPERQELLRRDMHSWVKE